MCKLKKRLPALLTVFLIVLSLVLPAVPVQAAETAVIKAGTYRFNDVLTYDAYYTVECAILFNFSLNGATITGNGIYERSLDDWLTLAYSSYIPDLGGYTEVNVYNDGWYTDDFGEGIKTITISTDSEVSSEFYEWFTSNTVPVNVLNFADGFLYVFSGVGSWLVSGVNSLISMFYVDGSLSFVGYLAVAGLAISVILLIFWLISGWLKFK